MRANAIPGKYACPGFRFPGLLAATLCLIPLTAVAIPADATAKTPLPIRLSAASVHVADARLEGVSAVLEGGGAVVAVAHIRPAVESSLAVSGFSLHCPVLGDLGTKACAGGDWALEIADAKAGWELPFRGGLEQVVKTGNSWNLRGNVFQGSREGQVEALIDGASLDARLTWKKQAVAGLPAIVLLPEFIQWVTGGVSSGEARWQSATSSPATITYDFEVGGLGFDSPDGQFAAENLDAHGNGSIVMGESAPSARAAEPDFKGGIELEIQRGEALLGDLYLSFTDQPLRIASQARVTGNQVEVSQLDVSDGMSLVLGARANWNLDQPDAPIGYQIDRLEMKFPMAYQRYIESAVSAATLDGLTVTGNLAWKGAGPDGPAGAGVLDVSDLSIVDTKRGRFAVTGLEAHVIASERQTPGRNSNPGGGAEALESRDLESRFSWRGLLLRRINLGAGSAALVASPGHVSLAEPLLLKVLGGQLALDELEVNMPTGSAEEIAEPEIRLFASLKDLDVDQLTEALEWPRFGGTISGQIPGVTLREGVLAVEGEIEFKVFSGQVLLSGVHVERPFGVLPSLAANLEVRDLDLQQLTQTFSFGHISGQMSGYVHDLRMLDWKPVAFDAWFGTPSKEQGSHEISRQAVNHLTTLGGGGATAALTGPVMKLFNNFSYKRLGLGCRLNNNTCEVRGLDDDDVSVLIMEGAGIPKIMIRAFNRQMDFASLVAGLSAASKGESIRIGDEP